MSPTLPTRHGDVRPGDVILTRFDGWSGRLIRFGAALRELVTGLPNPNTQNHVIIVTGPDELGVWQGVEARADGVGWVEVEPRLRSPWALTNAGQPKTAEQRARIVALAVGCVGVRYDWPGIVIDGLRALGIDRYWRDAEFPDDGRLPTSTVCSALADWCYETGGLANPGGAAVTRFTSPADWVAFITAEDWRRVDRVS